MKPTSVRVVIADPSPMARAGLAGLLATDARFDLVADVGSCRAVLDRLPELRPDLLIVELTRHDLGAFRELRSAAPDGRLLVLSGSEDLVGEAVRAGADGFLLNEADGGEILAALDRLLNGEAVLASGLAFQAIRAEAYALVPPEPLTARELEVLRLVSRGHTNPQIAERLYLAVGTVKIHIEHIISKLGAKDRTDAAVRAASHGLLLNEATPTAERHMPAGR
jgi:DNA-binding NarL/FixJ family response regulator